MTIPCEDNLHYISGRRQPLGEEKAAVNATEYTRLILLAGFKEEGLWLPVLAIQHTSHEIAHGIHTRHSRLQPYSLTRSAPCRDAFVIEKLELCPEM